jgi:hypothetical protein
MVYSPEMVALLQQLRSRIFAEFGARIRLADPNLLDTVAELGKRSRDTFTQKTVTEVMALAGIPFIIGAEKSTLSAVVSPGKDLEPVAMTYRGAKVYKDKPLDARAISQTPKPSRQMYRGQVVYK